MQFHVVVAGRCFTNVNGKIRLLEAGDVFLLTRGIPHVVCSDDKLRATAPPYPTEQGDEFPCIRHPGTGAMTTLFCGFLAFDDPVFDPLMVALPAVIVDRTGRSAAGGWFNAMLEHVMHAGRPRSRSGWRAMEVRLVELMFLEVVRRYVAALPKGAAGWLAALRDPQVGRCVAEIHADPGHRWTVAALARRVGLSRSRLAERFATVARMSPMRYVASWRLQVAASMMRRSEVSIAEAAARVGYRSEAAFHRAFKRLVGLPPATWRATVARARGSSRVAPDPRLHAFWME